MKRVLLASLLLASCATPQPKAPPAISEAELRATIAVLASDEFEGRMPGTAGEAKAAVFIADRYRAAGLKPPPGGFLMGFAVDHQPKDPPPATAKLPAGQRTFIEQMNRHPRFTATNVVGRVPGRAPDGRAVVVMAHYDHLGLCQPPGSADRVCNGAVDNASGVAAIIAVAERVAKMRLDRDVWFVATSAEEWGLLGAKAFAANPPLPLGSIIAAFNLDTIAIVAKGAPVAMISAEGSVLEPMVRAAAATMGRAWDGDGEAAPFLKRQDGWALAEKGVPAIMAGGSFSDFKQLQAFLARDYHGPEDELRPETELGGAVEDANLHIELVRRAASRRLLPASAAAPKVARR